MKLLYCKINWLLFGVVSSVLIVSCATIGSQTQGKNGVIVRGQQQNPTILRKNQFLSVTHKVTNPEYLQASNWSKIRIFFDLLNTLKAHKYFSHEEKFELFSFIFDELPINGSYVGIRDVYIGKYFLNGDPLIIRVGVFTPKKESALSHEKVIVFKSNQIILNDGTLNNIMGNFISLDSNASIFCLLDEDLLTNGLKMERKDQKLNATIDSLPRLEQIMIAIKKLADENISNDFPVYKLMTKIVTENKAEPGVIFLAMMQQYYFLLSIEDIQNASILWEKIKAYSVKVPGNLNPDSLEAIDGAFLYLMKRLHERNKGASGYRIEYGIKSSLLN